MTDTDIGIIVALLTFAAASAVLLWREPKRRAWTPPNTRDGDISREREALTTAAHRIGHSEGVRSDLTPYLDDFAASLAERVADGKTSRANAIMRITAKARKLAGPGSASAAALAIRQAQGIAEDAP